jgi:hypothetical protein
MNMASLNIPFKIKQIEMTVLSLMNDSFLHNILFFSDYNDRRQILIN